SEPPPSAQSFAPPADGHLWLELAPGSACYRRAMPSLGSQACGSCSTCSCAPLAWPAAWQESASSAVTPRVRPPPSWKDRGAGGLLAGARGSAACVRRRSERGGGRG